jgi:GDP-L-fucose synthase
VFNVGTGTDIPIGELAAMVCRIAGFHGDLVFDTSKPDGTPRKLLDVSRLAGMGWRASIGLEAGITRTWHEFASARQGQASAVA